jgi:hypothetical protein
MGFEDMVNEQSGRMADRTAAASERAALRRHTFESMLPAAAANMKQALVEARDYLWSHGARTRLAVTTAGPDGAGWHFVAEALGWPLENFKATAFLTEDARICFGDKKRDHGGNDFLPDGGRVLARFEKGSAVKMLANPSGLTPQSG